MYVFVYKFVCFYMCMLLYNVNEKEFKENDRMKKREIYKKEEKKKKKVV